MKEMNRTTKLDRSRLVSFSIAEYIHDALAMFKTCVTTSEIHARFTFLFFFPAPKKKKGKLKENGDFVSIRFV